MWLYSSIQRDGGKGVNTIDSFFKILFISNTHVGYVLIIL